VTACLLGHITDPCKPKLQAAIRNRVISYSLSIRNASSGLMNLVSKIYRSVTITKTVEIPEEFIYKSFICHLMVGTRETSRRNGGVHTLHETDGATKYHKSLKNHMTMNLERFMIRAVFAPYPGISRNGIWATINGITNDGHHEDEIEFIDKKTSHRSKSEASVIRARIQEHRGVLRRADPTEKISELKKNMQRYYRLILRYFMFLDRELERKAEVTLSGGK